VDYLYQDTDILLTTPGPFQIQVTILEDELALEPNRTLKLNMEPISSTLALPSSPSIFFQDSIDITIVDPDVTSECNSSRWVKQLYCCIRISPSKCISKEVVSPRRLFPLHLIYKKSTLTLKRGSIPTYFFLIFSTSMVSLVEFFPSLQLFYGFFLAWVNSCGGNLAAVC